MGTLRLFLALAVLVGHLSNEGQLFLFGYEWLGASYSVQAFFIISGFYMAMVLTEKYRTVSIGSFYTARALKLYPLYYLTVLATILALVLISNFGVSCLELQYLPKLADTNRTFPALICRPYPELWSLLDFSSVVLLVTTHITLIGQELNYFVSSGVYGLLHVTDHYALDEAYGTHGSKTNIPNLGTRQVMIEWFTLVPQAWSLSVEFLFYLIAPWLIKRKTSQLVISTVILLALRIYFFELVDPTTGPAFTNLAAYKFKFFPFELCFFLLGICSYRLYTYVRDSERMQAKQYNFIAITSVILAAIFAAMIPWLAPWGFYTILLLAMPFAFVHDRNLHADVSKKTIFANFHRLDRILGDLSYPLYISHTLIIICAYGFFHDFAFFGNTQLHTALIIGISIGVAALLQRFVQFPIDNFRAQQIKSVKRPQSRAERRRVKRKKAQ